MTENDVNKIFYNYSTNEALVEENKFLRETIENMQKELQRYKSTPLIVCEVKELHGDNALVRLPNGNEFFVEKSPECKNIKPGESALAEQKNLTLIKKIQNNKKFDVEKFVIIEKPQISWEKIGGLKQQEQEIKEIIELPLKNPKLFSKIGIEPPKGMLLHGPP